MRFTINISATFLAALPAAAAFIISTGCVNEKPEDCFVTITPDWSKRTSGVDVPGVWRVLLDDYAASADTPSHTVGHRFAPATYPLEVYNEADHITMEGERATVDLSTGLRIHNNPGWLFTCATDIAIDGGERQKFTVPMRQQVRQLTLIISPQGEYFDHVSAISGVLTGVAGSLDRRTGLHGTPSRVTLDFRKITFGDGAGKWRAVVRLLGIAPPPTTQRIELRVTMTDPDTARSREMAWSSELTGQMAGFNSGKDIPLSLEGVIAPEDAGPEPDETGPDPVGMITDWRSNAGGSLTAQ
jgi:hypothetical protein